MTCDVDEVGVDVDDGGVDPEQTLTALGGSSMTIDEMLDDSDVKVDMVD